MVEEYDTLYKSNSIDIRNVISPHMYIMPKAVLHTIFEIVMQTNELQDAFIKDNAKKTHYPSQLFPINLIK